MTTKPILIAGPTASGKSALAIALARACDGMVINADSQQVYREWRVLTARPSDEEEAAAPHALYGHAGLAEDYSVGHWLEDVKAVLDNAATTGRTPIIVGGTGLYFRALCDGLAPMPQPDPAIRARGEAILSDQGLMALVDDLRGRDPDTAARIDLENPRRVLRAWEVLEGTGRGLAAWQAETPPPLLPLSRCTAIALTPDRDWLVARCERRFHHMLNTGAIDEARTVLAMDIPANSPGLRAVGAPELFAWLQGDVTLDEATERAIIETRRYAKRQMTWIRNQMSAWHRLDPAQPDMIERAVDLIGI